MRIAEMITGVVNAQWGYARRRFMRRRISTGRLQGAHTRHDIFSEKDISYLDRKQARLHSLSYDGQTDGRTDGAEQNELKKAMD